MNIQKTFYIAVAALVLVACKEERTGNYTSYNLDHRFSGHPASELFNEYGFPQARYERANGDVMYEWSSTELKVFPGQAAVHTYYSDKGTYQVVENPNPKEELQYCKLRIYTNPAEIIQRIDIKVDSIGKWSNSYCSEIFD